jgi:hypothetical protein
MLWLIAPGSARAIEWDMFADLAPALRACLDQQLGTEALSQLIALGGQRPENKALRKNASRAFKSCRESAGEVQPPGAPPPTEKACGALPAPYAGSLFDAMTQIDEREDMAAMVERVRAAGIERMALFARSRKSLGHNEDKVLALRARWPDFLVLGAPKYFLLDGDLDDDYIDATLSGVQEHRYAFIGEVLYTHGDKSHGETTARGERQVDPAAPGTAKLLAGLARLGQVFHALRERAATDLYRAAHGVRFGRTDAPVDARQFQRGAHHVEKGTRQGRLLGCGKGGQLGRRLPRRLRPAQGQVAGFHGRIRGPRYVRHRCAQDPSLEHLRRAGRDGAPMARAIAAGRRQFHRLAERAQALFAA